MGGCKGLKAYKMFTFIKKEFIIAMTLVGCGGLKCVSMSNQECKKRPAILDIYSNEPLFYPDSVLVNKCSGSCNDNNNPPAKLWVPEVVKNMSI